MCILNFNGKAAILAILLLPSSCSLRAGDVAVFFESDIKPISFAAHDAKKALESNNHTVELRNLENVAGYSGAKVIIVRVGDHQVLQAMVAEGGRTASGLKPQGLALRTTTDAAKLFWAIGGTICHSQFHALIERVNG